MELNQSAIKTLMRCQERYRREYIEGERMGSSVPALRGTGVHRAAAVNFREKVKSHGDMRKKDFEELAIEEFRAAAGEDGILFSKEEKPRARQIMNEAQHSVKRIASTLILDVAPLHQPTAVEQKHSFQLPSGVVVHGTLDIETDQHLVLDFKTTTTKPQVANLIKSIQPTMYHMLYNLIHKRPPEAVLMEYIIDKGGRVQHETHRLTKTTDDYRALLNTVDTAAKSIQTGVFMGVHGQEGAWWCSKKWCPYWSTCEFVPKGER